MAIRHDSEIAQVTWSSRTQQTSSSSISTLPESRDSIENSIISSARHHFELRREPSPYIHIHAAALEGLCTDSSLNFNNSTSPGEIYGLIHPQIEEAISKKNSFIRFGGGEKSLETSYLWCDEISSSGLPLAERVEISLVEYLQTNPNREFTQIDHAICQAYPGLLTPDNFLIRICIESYTETSEVDDQRILRFEDDINLRSVEIESMRSSIFAIGKKLGFECRGDNPVIWTGVNEQPEFVFYSSATSVIWEYLNSNPFSPQISFIVLPGARISILMHKIRRNPLLRQEIDKGWRIIKYRLIRHLLESPSVSRESFEDMLSLDPLTESPAQMRLL
jgi:hypothetical protein